VCALVLDCAGLDGVELAALDGDCFCRRETRVNIFIGGVHAARTSEPERCDDGTRSTIWHSTSGRVWDRVCSCSVPAADYDCPSGRAAGAMARHPDLFDLCE